MSDNWGRWGPEDEVGALNVVTGAVTRAAVGLVQIGRTMSLTQPLGPGTEVPPHRARPSRFMSRDAGDYALGARTPGGFRFAEDTVQFHTHSGTHVDALAHAWSGAELYNGHPESGTRTTRGAQRCGADKLVPVVTRGVLIDLVALSGAPLPPRAAIEADDLRAALRASDTALQPGDAVLIRTGWHESRNPRVDYFDNEPGIDGGAAKWLAGQDVALVGSDNYAVEVQGRPDSAGFPAHLVLLHRHGVPLVENLALAALADEGRSTFLFVFAPIPLVGSTGSPVNPVVVL